MWSMKKHSWTLFLGIFLCILCVSNTVLAVDKAYFTADKTTSLIGEPVQLILHIRIPLGAKLIPPDFSRMGSPFFVKEVGSLNVVSQAENDEIEYELPLTVILWQTGQYLTPPLVISYQLDGASLVNLSVESIQVVVPSVLDANDLSLRPLKAQINLPYFPIWTFAIALFVVVALGIVAVRYRLIRLRGLQSQSNILSDKWHPEANVALILLKQFGQSQDNPPAIYVEVSDCLRRYLDARFAVQASDLTTSELVTKLEEQHTLTDEHQQKLVDMLKRADLVKFARVVPKLNAAQQYASVAAQWIQSVEQTHNEQLP